MFLAAFAISLAAIALFHQIIYGTPVGGYGLLNSEAGLWKSAFLNGLFGVLFSPSRGWIVYYPYLLLIPLFLHSYRDDPRLSSLATASAAVLLVNTLLAAFYVKWWGGYGLGPRLITESSPFIALLTIPIWMGWRKFGWRSYIFALLVLFSMMTQILSVYNESAFLWNNRVDVDANSRAMWSWRNSQLNATWNPFWRAN